MANMNINYIVTGRYMDGNKVIGYHLVGDDGTEIRESRERIIRLISKGLVKNMRLQDGPKGTLIIRGKGVNLNELPVYDPNKNKLRNIQNKVNIQNNIRKYVIKSKIYSLNNKLIGYVIQDTDYGDNKIIKAQAIIGMINRGIITNATIHIINGKSVVRITTDVEILYSKDGKILNNKQNLTVRVLKVEKPAILRDTSTKASKQLNAGEFIVLDINGSLRILSGEQIKQEFNNSNISIANSDLSKNKVKNIEIEFLGLNRVFNVESIIGKGQILQYK